MTLSNIATWTEMAPCDCGEDCGKEVAYLVQNGVHLGAVITFDGGAYYPVTQMTRFGAHLTLESAKSRVEDFAAYEVYVYPTRGNA